MLLWYIFISGNNANYTCRFLREIILSVSCSVSHHHHHHHHHHISVMELCHLLTRSGLTYPEVSSKVCHDSFFQLGNSVSLPWVIYYGAFCLHVVSSFSCIPVICLKLVLFLIRLQFVHLFSASHVAYTCCVETKQRSFGRGILQTHSLAQRIVNMLLGVAVNRFTRSDGINHL